MDVKRKLNVRVEMKSLLKNLLLSEKKNDWLKSGQSAVQ